MGGKDWRRGVTGLETHPFFPFSSALFLSVAKQRQMHKHVTDHMINCVCVCVCLNRLVWVCYWPVKMFLQGGFTSLLDEFHLVMLTLNLTPTLSPKSWYPVFRITCPQATSVFLYLNHWVRSHFHIIKTKLNQYELAHLTMVQPLMMSFFFKCLISSLELHMTQLGQLS